MRCLLRGRFVLAYLNRQGHMRKGFLESTWQGDTTLCARYGVSGVVMKCLQCAFLLTNRLEKRCKKKPPKKTGDGSSKREREREKTSPCVCCSSILHRVIARSQ